MDLFHTSTHASPSARKHMHIFVHACHAAVSKLDYLSLSAAVQVWLGYQQSLRPSQGGLTLNVDLAATAFLQPQPVIDFLMRATGLRSPRDFNRLTPQQHRTASKAITGLKVTSLLCPQMVVLSPQLHIPKAPCSRCKMSLVKFLSPDPKLMPLVWGVAWRKARCSVGDCAAG